MKFNITERCSDTSARTGAVYTDHGEFETPAFMPVGTQATVKTLSPLDIEETGSQIILHNTYHLYLRPGPDLFLDFGGAHNFGKWNLPLLTDSGGYQVFSLADLNKISEDGVRFQSHLDGSYHFFSPEDIIDIQKKIGADIIMPLDRPAPYPAEKIDVQKANRITLNWLKRSKNKMKELPSYYDYSQALFGIVQGGIFKDLRKYAVEETVAMDFPGYSIGGLSVGEPGELLYELADYTADLLPGSKPRYLMGVGKPDDLITCIGYGIDMFDCVLPTRVGRNGWMYTDYGRIVITNAEYKDDKSPVDENCNCYACRTFSKSYIKHLFQAGEMLGPRLASLHNITYYQKIMIQARQEINNNNFKKWQQDFLNNFRSGNNSN